MFYWRYLTKLYILSATLKLPNTCHIPLFAQLNCKDFYFETKTKESPRENWAKILNLYKILIDVVNDDILINEYFMKCLRM